MSVTVMQQVWKHGPQGAKERDDLLVLLAIADHADDDGRCFPSMAGIAEKARMTERGARGIVRRLEAKGFLQTQVGGGRGGKSRYLVVPNPEQQTGNDDTKAEWQTGNEAAKAEPPAAIEPETRNRGSAEPSVEKKEREDTDVSSCRTPPTDLADAVATFNAAASRQGWPRIVKMTPDRGKALRARLRDLDGADGWQNLVGKAEAARALQHGATGPPTWFTFDWLLKPANFVKVLEGNYDRSFASRSDLNGHAGAPIGFPGTPGHGRSASIASIVAGNHARRAAGG